MNLRKKKALAAKTLEVGKERIIFIKTRLDEIKEAITKQDIRDLYSGGAIMIKEIGGRKKIKRKRKRATVGNTRKKIKRRKRKYLILTRKLRNHLNEYNKIKEIPEGQTESVRKKIKNKEFRNKSDMTEYLNNLVGK